MPSPTEPTRGVVWQSTGCFVMRRVTGNAGTNITQASISTITAKVFDRYDGSLALNIGSVATTNISDTLVTTALDPRWTEDSTGYNFSYTLPATAFPDGDRTYIAEFIFTPASGQPFGVVFEIEAKALRTFA